MFAKKFVFSIWNVNYYYYLFIIKLGGGYCLCICLFVCMFVYLFIYNFYFYLLFQLYCFL